MISEPRITFTTAEIRHIEQALTTLLTNARAHTAQLARLAQITDELANLLLDPSIGLLVSIAMRMDHALLMQLPDEKPDEHLNRIERTMNDARRALEEVSGTGFWTQERDKVYEAYYLAVKERIEGHDENRAG